ncbi:MAG: SusC/RagA family TonB-linked outer membrane protein, partial [Alistipes sp.]|nr:SusC/RagA family TonB-linked outer membrane protein [Alistipes sp.]
MQRFLTKSLFAVVLSLLSMSLYAQGEKVTVSGVVTSAEDKLPLIGVAVVTEAMSGVTTSIDGDYTIEVEAGTKLTFQYVGYQTTEWLVPTGQSSATFNLEMLPEAQAVEEVVVIAYGVRKKGTVAGSVSTIKAEKIENTPTAAFDQALQGQVPGLTVLSNTGEPSAAAVMTIRGTNSINSGTAPLYILDGVPISSSDFNTINPADIESLSVLKDASSTSIYGARAANGVIVITTKRGRMADRPHVEYRMQLGISQVAHGKWDLMNTAERIQYEKEIGMTAGQNYALLSQTDVNWMEEVFKSDAMLQSHEISMSGADEKTNYYLSAGYYSQEGTAVGSLFDRYSLRTNIERRATDWLKVGTNTMLNYQEIQQADEGSYTLVTPISAARFMMPYWSPYRADGSLASVSDGSWKGTGQNPLEWLENNPVEYKKYKLISTLFAEATPIEGLTIRSQFSLDYGHTTGFGKSYPSYAPNQNDGSASRSTTDSHTLTVTNTIN